jgi:regulator of protease activity HflC (stomatin/prohibitin superfamily)
MVPRMSSEQSNAYLDRVVAQQAALEEDLRPSPSMKRARAAGSPPASANAVDVRVTGVGRWKTVLVPPNAFVVHTRRGHAEPVHIGLGISFRYNPFKDSFLVVPGTMQTILLNAYCICRELQGVVVQAYVQWIVQDIATAYQKLDFGDASDPMRLVNLQLKEQAEAAIKDKVATMGVHEVLSDKQPIIEELTTRLRDVAEGGLGLRIVTVQIKEAIVSSTRLWENLQKPYRAEQNQRARLAELAADEVIAQRQSVNERAAAAQRDETQRHAIALEQERHTQEVEIGRLRAELALMALEAELATAKTRADHEHAIKLLEIERSRLRQEISDAQTPAGIQARLIGQLPEIVSKLPKPLELKSVSLGGDTSTLPGIVAQVKAILNAL